MYTLQCKHIHILFNSFYYLKFNDLRKNIFREISISRETAQEYGTFSVYWIFLWKNFYFFPYFFTLSN